MPRCLLLDRSAIDRAALRHRLSVHPDVQVTGEGGTMAEARELLSGMNHDLVFADTHLVGGSSFDLVAELGPHVRLVLVTASEAHAVRAFEIGALDYILKPASAERLSLAISRHAGASRLDEKPAACTRGALAPDDTLRLRCGNTTRFAPVRQISVITAQDNYSEVTLACGNRAFLRRTLKSWEDTLPTPLFMRVHRTQIVNLARVTCCRRDRAAHTFIELEGLRQPVVASRHRWTQLRDRLRLE